MNFEEIGRYVDSALEMIDSPLTIMCPKDSIPFLGIIREEIDYRINQKRKMLEDELEEEDEA